MIDEASGVQKFVVLGTLKPSQHGSIFGARLYGRSISPARAHRGRDDRERGRGMLAVEPDDARRYCEALQGRGILAKDTHGHTIRIAPPLVITGDQVDWALERIAATLTQNLP